MMSNSIILSDENELLYDCQFGFRRGHLTTHAVITFVENVTQTLEKRKYVFFDLKKHLIQLIIIFYFRSFML